MSSALQLSQHTTHGSSNSPFSCRSLRVQSHRVSIPVFCSSAGSLRSPIISIAPVASLRCISNPANTFKSSIVYNRRITSTSTTGHIVQAMGTNMPASGTGMWPSGRSSAPRGSTAATGTDSTTASTERDELAGLESPDASLDVGSLDSSTKYPHIGRYDEMLYEASHPAFGKLPFPTLRFRGTVKLHGTHGDIIRDEEGNVTVRSRNRQLTPESDNLGFAKFVDGLDTSSEGSGLFASFPLGQQVMLAGEYCGKGVQKYVGISKLQKFFVIFNVRIGYTWQNMADFAHLADPARRVFNITQLPSYDVNITRDPTRPREVEAPDMSAIGNNDGDGAGGSGSTQPTSPAVGGVGSSSEAVANASAAAAGRQPDSPSQTPPAVPTSMEATATSAVVATAAEADAAAVAAVAAVRQRAQPPQEIMELTEAVYKECPAALAFGGVANGRGEGIVWTCLDQPSPRLWFKAKGSTFDIPTAERFDKTEVELKRANVRDAAAAATRAFVERAITPRRLHQGLEYLREFNLPLTIASIQKFMDWVVEDALREEGGEMEAAERTAAWKPSSTKAAAWFKKGLAEGFPDFETGDS